jgi:hypothetical protein
MTELTARRKADRLAMALQVVDLAGEYGLAAEYEPEQPGTRRTTVGIVGPHGLKLAVWFYGDAYRPDIYGLHWHGVEEGTRLHPGMFGNVNLHHGHKATDVARGHAQLMRILRERFAAIREGFAFITEGQASS